MKRLLIVAHQPSARTRELAEALLDGANDPAVEDVDARLCAPLHAGPQDVLDSDAIILSTTENFGLLAGLSKDFLERIYYPCLERTEGRPWALCVRAGNDGEGAVRSTTRIVTGLRWRAATEPLVLSGDWQDDFAERARELGLLVAASLEAGIV